MRTFFALIFRIDNAFPGFGKKFTRQGWPNKIIIVPNEEIAL